MAFVVADRLVSEDRSDDFLAAWVGRGFRERQQTGYPVLRERLADEEPSERLLDGDGNGERAVGFCPVVGEGRGTDDANQSSGIECA